MSEAQQFLRRAEGGLRPARCSSGGALTGQRMRHHPRHSTSAGSTQPTQKRAHQAAANQSIALTRAWKPEVKKQMGSITSQLSS